MLNPSFILELINVPPKTHCSGKTTEPLVSGAAYEPCDKPGCTGLGLHHACAGGDATYCECRQNKDKTFDGRPIKYYFKSGRREEGNIDCICYSCRNKCNF